MRPSKSRQLKRRRSKHATQWTLKRRRFLRTKTTSSRTFGFREVEGSRMVTAVKRESQRRLTPENWREFRDSISSGDTVILCGFPARNRRGRAQLWAGWIREWEGSRDEGKRLKVVGPNFRYLFNFFEFRNSSRFMLIFL